MVTKKSFWRVAYKMHPPALTQRKAERAAAFHNKEGRGRRKVQTDAASG